MNSTTTSTLATPTAAATAGEFVAGRARRCLVAGVLVAAVAGLGHADDVHLTNGAVFEDVSTETTATHVIIEMNIGRLRLPNEQIARIVEGSSPIEEHRQRSNELLSDPGSRAEDFLELARWSVRQGLVSQARQSALIAARLGPDLAGLQELLAGLGYEHVHGIGWLPYDEAQRSRGLVLFEGQWLTRTEREERIAEEQRSSAARTTAGRNAQPSDRDIALESIELARRSVEAVDDASQRAAQSERRDERPRRLSGHGFVGHGPRFGDRQNNVYGGVVLPIRGVDPAAAAAYQERLSRDLKSLASRAPGSLIPVQQHRPPD